MHAYSGILRSDHDYRLHARVCVAVRWCHESAELYVLRSTLKLRIYYSQKRRRKKSITCLYNADTYTLCDRSFTIHWLTMMNSGHFLFHCCNRSNAGHITTLPYIMLGIIYLNSMHPLAPSYRFHENLR